MTGNSERWNGCTFGEKYQTPSFCLGTKISKKPKSGSDFTAVHCVYDNRLRNSLARKAASLTGSFKQSSALLDCHDTQHPGRRILKGRHRFRQKSDGVWSICRNPRRLGRKMAELFARTYPFQATKKMEMDRPKGVSQRLSFFALVSWRPEATPAVLLLLRHKRRPLILLAESIGSFSYEG